jgi:hypothetical protein
MPCSSSAVSVATSVMNLFSEEVWTSLNLDFPYDDDSFDRSNHSFINRMNNW